MLQKERKLRYSLEEIQAKISKYHPEIEVLELIETKYIKCHCNKCGADYTTNKYNAINSHSGCPVCINKLVVKGINDIATTNPELVKYFIDKEYIETHAIVSTKETGFKCPDCGYIRIMAPCVMFQKGHFFCPQCSDGVSYPNKFMREVFKQLGLEVKWEYQPEWAKPYYYDNYFELNGKKYIVEVDGAYHYEGTRDSDMFKKINADTSRRDNIKNKLALEHNIILIRIDAQESDSDYIKNNILTSELSNLFDLSQIDWNLCDKNSLSSKVIEACNLLNQNFSVDEIANKLQISSCSVRNYLKRGKKLNLCNYGGEDYIPVDSTRTVYAFDKDKELILIAKNQEDCAIKLEQKYNIHFTSRSILDAIKKERSYNNCYYITNKKIKNTKDKSLFQLDLERRIKEYESSNEKSNFRTP